MKDNKPFHVCRCANRSFTSEEWCKHLHDEKTPQYALSYKNFNFNWMDVCVTPNIPVEFEDKNVRYTIHTAQSPSGLWSYGMSWMVGYGGGGFAPSFVDGVNDNHRKSYATEKEAVFNALCQMEGIIKKSSKNINAFVLEQLNKYIAEYDPRQLSMYDLWKI